MLHEGWQAKRRISTKISSPRIDELYSLARNHGALGGKITGEQPAVREAMRQQNVQEMTFGFDMQGAQAIVNDPFINRDDTTGCRWTFVPNAKGVRIA